MSINEITILHHEPLIRLGCFGGVLAIVALGEAIAPRRTLAVSKLLRWVNNLGLGILNTVLVRATLPWAAVGVAQQAAEQHWGLLNNIAVAAGPAVLFSLIALDLAIYLQHLGFHAIPSLWRLHQVHHTDLDVDVTTALRFHPIEILLSMGLKMIAIVLLGAPALAVLIFEVLLNATAMFNHGNITLPGQWERLLHWLVVTPDMHRVHHSILPLETNSNFGFNLPWWDYIFGTYRDRSPAAHQELVLGLAEYQNNPRVEQLPWLLALPFRAEEPIEKI